MSAKEYIGIGNIDKFKEDIKLRKDKDSILSFIPAIEEYLAREVSEKRNAPKIKIGNGLLVELKDNELYFSRLEKINGTDF